MPDEVKVTVFGDNQRLGGSPPRHTSTIHIDFLTLPWFIAEQTETIGKNVAMYIGFTVFESHILSVKEESLVWNSLGLNFSMHAKGFFR